MSETAGAEGTVAEVVADAVPEGGAVESVATEETTLLTGEIKEEVEATEKPAEGEAQTDEKDAKPEGAPEKYDFKLPEGVTLDPDAIAEFEPLARDLNLTQDAAQKLIDLECKRMQAIQKAQFDSWQSTLKGWVSDIKADPEFGGAKMPQTLKEAQSVVKKYGSEGLMEVLNVSGLGNHPEVIKTLAKIGRAMSEDKIINGGTAAAPRDLAKVLFPDLN